MNLSSKGLEQAAAETDFLNEGSQAARLEALRVTAGTLTSA
jgi:hypothetical protein